MSKEKHTPTPWLVVEDEDEEEVIIVQKNNYKPHFYTPVSEFLKKEDAELIVKAVNNHNRLIETLDKMANAYGFNARIDARNNAKQLLTELKS